MDSQSSLLRVLIVGTGSAGLLFAHALKKVGIAYTVFERDTSLYQRPRDWNFSIHWGQNGLKSCLPEHLHPLIKAVQTDPSYDNNENNSMPIYNGQTGELLNPNPVPFAWRVQRRKWLAMLQDGLDIKWGKRLQHIETSNNIVTITFEDGTKESGNLLVGAEGAHSLTREYLLGPKEAALLPAPIVSSITISRVSREAALALRALNRNHVITLHPESLFTWTGVHDASSEDPAEWTFMLIQSWRSDEPTGLEGDDAILQDMYMRGKKYAYPWNEVFTSIPLGTKVWHNRLSTWSPKAWDGAGLVTIAGDAAHPITFHRGQGVNNAIADAADFLIHLQTMKEHTPEELIAAVKKYDEALVPRGREAVLAAYNNSMLVHDWETAMQSPLFTKGLSKYQLEEEDIAAIKIVDVAGPAAENVFAEADETRSVPEIEIQG
ncbi:FAD/NAD(P)-binding domain-containing protein [Mollisia scopiformis]|uniref:FAD/NAD(P)-binding domain-containing protein n=1 Tax=Mollisia scopiformis TaxID=149040 RepID=A0A194X163_MOLSC|nr:FAD/NAD(P)-binding domain-containing protein [Mollisia scopiformis]KUJ13930.1 FAD/NAD(P)-binding domain-containing protein [Mollisia scopiformis]